MSTTKKLSHTETVPEEEIIVPDEGKTDVLYTPPETNPSTIGSLTANPQTGSTEVKAPMSAVDYATFLRDESIKQAEEQRKAAIEASELSRKRTIADANSSYQKSLATYGQNAEKLASMGLSGSGYGEYLTSGAYAQNRSAVQSANAQHLATEKDALYREGQAKLEANSKYYSDMLGIQADQNNAYSNLMNSALSGASIESIMASGQWGTITSDQQKQITNVALTNSYKIRIDGGESMDDIMNDPNFYTLSQDAQNQIKNYYDDKQKGLAAENLNAYTNFITLLKNGTPFESLAGMVGYNLMDENQIAEFERIDASNRSKDAYNKALQLIDAGKSLEEIQGDESIWGNLLPEDAAEIEKLAKDSDKASGGEQIDSMIVGGYNWDDIMESDAYKNASETDQALYKKLYEANLNAEYKDLRLRARDGDESVFDDADYARLTDTQKSTVKDDYDLYKSKYNVEIEENKQAVEQVVKTFDDLNNEIINGDIDNLNDLRNDDGYKARSETQKKKLDNIMYTQIADRLYENQYDDFITSLDEYAIEMDCREEDKAKIMEAWQNINLENLIEASKANGEMLSLVDVDELINGDEGYLPENAIEILQSEGLISDEYSSVSDLKTDYLNNDITAEEFLSEFGDVEYGGEDIKGITFDASDENAILYPTYKIKIGDKEFSLNLYSTHYFDVKADGNYTSNQRKENQTTVRKLNEISTGSKSEYPSSSTFAVYNNELYIYNSSKGKWGKAKTPIGGNMDDVIATIAATL